MLYILFVNNEVIIIHYATKEVGVLIIGILIGRKVLEYFIYFY